MKNIGKIVAQLRERKNMTQKELAEKVSIGESRLNEMEQGKEQIAPELLKEILSVFGYPAIYAACLAVEESDLPEGKKPLYRLMVQPFQDEILKEE